MANTTDIGDGASSPVSVDPMIAVAQNSSTQCGKNKKNKRARNLVKGLDRPKNSNSSFLKVKLFTWNVRGLNKLIKQRGVGYVESP